VSREMVDPLAPRFREPWSEGEDHLLGQWYLAGVPLAEIAQRLERDVTDVAWRVVGERWVLSRITLAG
jgi:hypothetical protein